MIEPTRSSVDKDLEYLIEGWPVLVALKIPGANRSWVEAPRKHVLSEADLERMGKKGVPRQAPADVGVLDLLAQIASTTYEVTVRVLDIAIPSGDALDDAHRNCSGPWAWGNFDAEIIAQDWLAPAFLRKFYPSRPASVDPRPWLDTLRTWVGAAQDTDDRTVPWVAWRFARIIEQMARLLGDVRDGQCMNGVCPWCGGLASDGVVGERTMQLHHPDVDDEQSEPLIVCFGTGCTPPTDACSRDFDGLPAWPRREWNWLASQLVDPADAARIDPTEDWASPGLRAAHRAYRHGVRTDVVRDAETEYQRLAKQHLRSRAAVLSS